MTRNGVRMFPAEWEHLTRKQLQRALRIMVRLGSMPSESRYEWRTDRSTGESYEVTSQRVERLREEMHALGLRALHIDNRTANTPPTWATRYRRKLQRSPGDSGLRKWIKLWLKQTKQGGK